MDPQLQGLGGHYLVHDQQLLGELRRRGVPATVYSRRGSTLTECAGAQVLPVFSLEIFQEAAADAQTWPIENFQTINTAFLADLLRIPPDRFTSSDLVYFPNILQNQIYGVVQWLSRLPEGRRPMVAILLRYLNHAMDYVSARANKELIPLFYRYACRELLRVQPRSLICADTRELAKAYEQMTELRVLELPNPMDVSALLDGAAQRPQNSRPVVIYQGHTSPLRGFHFVPEIIAHTRAHPSRPRFAVQVQNADRVDGMGLRPAYDALLSLQGPDVALLQGALSNKDYYEMLLSGDIVLLPYTPSFYGAGSSGVFSEAASLGKVVVVCDGTVPARQGREGSLGVVVAKDWTAKAMAEAVGEALTRLPELRHAAQAGAAAYRAENCAQTLWDRVLKALALD